MFDEPVCAVGSAYYSFSITSLFDNYPHQYILSNT